MDKRSLKELAYARAVDRGGLNECSMKNKGCAGLWESADTRKMAVKEGATHTSSKSTNIYKVS
jgi:hypothetical protein